MVRKLGDPVPVDPNERSIETRIESIKSSYDPNDPKCRFQTYFYNEVAMGQSVKNYARPPNATDERAWTKAVKENPDPDQFSLSLSSLYSGKNVNLFFESEVWYRRSRSGSKGSGNGSNCNRGKPRRTNNS